jgi:hypothetical protein
MSAYLSLFEKFSLGTNPRKNMVFGTLFPELTTTSLNVESIIDSNTFIMGNPYAMGVDFIPQSD